jgi:hypothetical protein
VDGHTNGHTSPSSPEAEQSPVEQLLAQEPPKIADLAQWGYVASWKRTPPPVSSLEQMPVEGDRWLIFADACGVGDGLAAALRPFGQPLTVVRPGRHFQYAGQNEYTIRPNQATDYQKLLQALRQQGAWPTKIVHLWSVTPAEGSAVSPEETVSQALTRTLSKTLDRGFYSLLFLAQALGNLSSEPCQLAIISSDMQDVTTATQMQPAKATLLGPYKVIPQELPHIRCCSIDISLGQAEAGLAGRLLDELAADFPAAVLAIP